jgi:hypothetical protein
MKKEIVHRIEVIARTVAATAENRAAIPLLVYEAVKAQAPDIIEHIARYRPAVDEYQVVASCIPPELVHPEAVEGPKGIRR